MQLIALEDVKARMVLDPSVSDSDPALLSAMVGAQTRIESELDTRLEAQIDLVETFLVDNTKFGGVVKDRMYRLRLKNGFLAGTPNVLWGNDLSLTGGGEAVPSTDFKVDLIRGYVYLPEDYEGDYVQVRYSCGFSDQDADIPGWLKEAVLAYIPAIFNMSQPTNRNNEAEKQYRLSADHAIACLSPYVRRLGFALDPVY